MLLLKLEKYFLKLKWSCKISKRDIKSILTFLEDDKYIHCYVDDNREWHHPLSKKCKKINAIYSKKTRKVYAI